MGFVENTCNEITMYRHDTTRNCHLSIAQETNPLTGDFTDQLLQIETQM